MKLNRRGLFGFLAGAALAAPALPAIVEGMAKSASAHVTTVRTGLPKAMWRAAYGRGPMMDAVAVMRQRNALMDELPYVHFRGIPIKTADRLA